MRYRTDGFARALYKRGMVTLQLDKLLDGRSHYWLAKQTGLPYSTIHRLARPDAEKITLAVLDKLCEALNCEPGDLLKRQPFSR